MLFQICRFIGFQSDYKFGDTIHRIDPNSGTEEYEPSMSVPQFVVTLTGLDSKLFPKDDADDLMDILNDDLEPGNSLVNTNVSYCRTQETDPSFYLFIIH